LLALTTAAAAGPSNARFDDTVAIVDRVGGPDEDKADPGWSFRTHTNGRVGLR
jgi:hypothetical protein